ncbi:putative ribonuclease H-like domain-containing protein [Tanacetum coccineum]|uniref:Ribonuclease H-like domain-containing protein n=1 Tax=Tanacetum coccineum TaxID=301880 RepID=A0ABQ5CLN4_9ASTR
MADQDTPPPTITAMKIPIIKKGEYDIWSMRMRQYICHTDHNLWDIIVNGDLEDEATPSGEQSSPPVPKTAKQLAARRNQERIKSILLLAIPDEYLLKFHNVPDAKSLWAAIKSRFGGNEESKKMQKNVLKHQFENFVTASNETLDKAYDRFQKLISQLEIHGAYVSKEDINQKFLRSLPPSWSQIALIMRNKPDIDEVDIDDLYNNLRVYEDELKRSSGSNSASQNLAFLSFENTNSTNEVSTASGDFGVSTAGGINQVPSTPSAHDIAYSFLAQPTTSPQLENEDFQQMDGDDLEELDLRWQVAMLTVRVKKFIQRTGRNMDFKEKRLVSLDKSKIECYNCHRKGHFARESQDGLGGYDWSNDFEVEPVNYALMEISSSNSSSSSDGEVQKCSKCLESFKCLQKNYDTEREKHNKAKLEIRGYEIALESLEARILGHEKNELAWELEKFLRKRDELKLKIRKWEGSSRNLTKILNSQMSTHDKNRLGFGIQMDDLSNKSETDSENSLTVFEVRSSDEESTLANNRFTKASEYHAVLPSNYRKPTNPRADISFAGLDEYAFRNKIIESKTTETNKTVGGVIGHSKIAQSNSVIRPYHPRLDIVRPKASNSPIKRSYFTQPVYRPKDLKPDVKTFGVNNMTTVGTRAVVSKGKVENVLKKAKWGNPEILLQDHAVVDSGCSSHMTGNKAYLSDYEDFNGGFVAFGSDPKGGKITGKGKIKTANLDFDDVYFVDELKFNLFSVSQMCDKKNSVLFTESECLILSPSFKLLDESQVVLRAPRKDGVYSLDLKNIVPSGGITCLYANATADESKLWHRRLGHVNFKNINKLVKGHLVRGLPSKVFVNDHTCVACKKGKQHKASCKAKLDRIIRKPLELLHMDLFGPVSIESINKKRYCLVVTDDFSRFSWVFFLATKDETSEILCNLIIGLEKQLNHNVKIIRCDNGTEFKNYVMNEFCAKKGIKREFSVARTPQQNGVAERKNRTLIEAARTMLADSLLPIPFLSHFGQRTVWDALEHFEHLRYPLGEICGKSDEGYLLGYSTTSTQEHYVAGSSEKDKEPTHKYKLLPLHPHMTRISVEDVVQAAQDVQDSEDVAEQEDHTQAFEEEKKRAAQATSINKLNTGRPSVSTSNSPLVSTANTPYASAASTPTGANNGGSSFIYLGGQIPIDASTLPNADLPIDPNMPDLEDDSNVFPNDGIFSGAYDDEDVGAEADFNNMDNTIDVSPIPTLRVHKDHPKEEPKMISQALEDESWVEAMQEELLIVQITKVWILLICHLDKGTIGTKWGLQDRAIREKVYVHQPPGFVDPAHPNKVYKVIKALYGLHQAPRAWYETLSSFLVKNHFRRGTIDKTLFIKKNKSDIMLVKVYVDDIIFGSTTQSMCTEFEDCMHKRFQMSSMGELTFFLGLQVKQQLDGILISQDKYVADILKKFDFCSIKSATTPIASNKPLVKDEDGVDVDVHVYRSMIGSLMYLTTSRPDIMFVVCACARDSPFELEAFSDSDCGGASLDRK